MKHSKLKITEPTADDARKITTKSYFEELNSYKEELEQSILTTHNTLLTDVIKCLGDLKTYQTPELSITIYSDKYGNPQRIVKRLTTDKKSFGK
jgi:hypothetical protein